MAATISEAIDMALRGECRCSLCNVVVDLKTLSRH